MGDKKYPMDQRHPSHEDGCMCERCYDHNYLQLNVVKVLHKIKNMLNEEGMQQFITDNDTVLYAITKRELEKANNQVNAIDKAIKIMELMPEMIATLEETMKDDCYDCEHKVNGVGMLLNKIKEIVG